MSNVKELFKAIITGKDYQEIFNQVMADKASQRIEQHKEVVAKSMFESDEASVMQKKADYTEKIIVDKTGKKRKVYANPTESAEVDEAELNELKSSTLASYVKKASHDVAAKGALTRSWSELSGRQKAEDKWMDARKSEEKADKIFAKSWKRRQSMAKAVDKLVARADESVDVENSDIESND